MPPDTNGVDVAIQIQSCDQNETDIDLPERIPVNIHRVGGPLIETNRTVWIIDTGVQSNNPDLNLDKKRSRNFVTTDPYDDAYDHNGHGTHVAGIIAGSGVENVFGIAPNNSVVSVRVLNMFGGGTWENVTAGIKYVSENAQTGDVINMSLGGTGHNDDVHNAVVETADKGILFAIAAGNSSSTTDDIEPAHIVHPNVFVVSAVDNDDCLASFSNRGSRIDFAAPGVDIISLKLNDELMTMSGTSMAAPHVAGLLLFGAPDPNGFVGCGDTDGIDEPIAHY